MIERTAIMRTVTLQTRFSAHEIAGAICDDEPFRISTGNLSGGPVTPGMPGEHGRLSEAMITTAVHETIYRADYVIRSYSTPIAWRMEGEWIIPWHGYSVTTSKHQGRVRVAVRETGQTVRPLDHRFVVGVRRDRGFRRVSIMALDQDKARAGIRMIEGCLDRSITSVRRAD